MKIGKFREIIGSPRNNRLSARNNQLAYGLAGDDVLTAKTDPLLGTQNTSILVGGFGFDTYVAARRGVTILMEYGNTNDENGTVEDTAIARGIGLTRQTSFVLSIDKRHLLAGDTKTGQLALLVDWKKSRNQIETFELSDGSYSYSLIANSYKKFPNYLGNYSWNQLESQKLLDLRRVGLSPSNVNRAIQSVVKRVNQLQGSVYVSEPFDESFLSSGLTQHRALH